MTETDGTVVFDREQVTAWHALGWMALAGLVGGIFLLGSFAVGVAIGAAAILGAVPVIVHVTTAKRVTLSATHLTVEYPVARTVVPYRDITGVELLQEKVPKTFTVVQLVVIRRRNASNIVLQRFEDGEIAVYGELHRRWDRARQPAPRAS